MSSKLILDLLDLTLLLWIALMERSSLILDRANNLLYRTFFEERTRWYSARNKKAPKESGGEENPVLAVMRESEDDTAESQPDPELPGEPPQS